MAKTTPNIKTKIPKNEDVFYVFKLSPAEYLLYDSSMGDPIAYGSLNLLTGKLNKQLDQLNKFAKTEQEKRKLYVYKLERDGVKGWKLNDRMNGMDYPKPIVKGAMHHEIPRSPMKDIGYEQIYFWIDMGNMNYLYDFDMGSPIWYGSPSKVKAVILSHASKHNFSLLQFYFPPKSKEPVYKLSIRYNNPIKKEQKDLKERKSEEQKDPTPAKKDDNPR